MSRKIMVFLLVLLWIALPGCGPNQAEINQVRLHSDPVADRMMKALDQDNYKDFSADFNENMKTSLPEAKFHELSSSTKKAEGSYQSISFYSLIKNQDSPSVQYYVMFSDKTSAFKLTLVFNHPDGSGQVTGFDLAPVITR